MKFLWQNTFLGPGERGDLIKVNDMAAFYVVLFSSAHFKVLSITGTSLLDQDPLAHLSLACNILCCHAARVK